MVVESSNLSCRFPLANGSSPQLFQRIFQMKFLIVFALLLIVTLDASACGKRGRRSRDTKSQGQCQSQAATVSTSCSTPATAARVSYLPPQVAPVISRVTAEPVYAPVSSGDFCPDGRCPTR